MNHTSNAVKRQLNKIEMHLQALEALAHGPIDSSVQLEEVHADIVAKLDEKLSGARGLFQALVGIQLASDGLHAGGRGADSTAC